MSTPALIVACPPTIRPVPPITDTEPRCWRCDRMIAYFATRPWRLQCSKCKAVNSSKPA